MSEYFEYQAYVGPPWSVTAGATFDWSVYAYGGSDSFDIATIASSTLSAGATTLSLFDASLFPSSGWVWIGPGKTDGTEGWEYCRYTGKSGSNLTGLVRTTLNREHNGVHTSSLISSDQAMVYFWYPLNKAEGGDLAWSWKLNETWSVKTWSATLSGVLAPKNVVRPGQSIIIQRKTTPTGLFTNFLQGWIQHVDITDDHHYVAEWSISIISSAGMIQRDEAPVFTIGSLNMGRSGQASASSTLAASWKEAGSGDYNAAYPSFDASNAADDSASSLWITDKYVGAGYTETSANASNDPTMNAFLQELMISQIHITGPAGQAYGYQWIELTSLGSKNWPALALWIGFEDAGTIDLTGRIPALVAGDKVIVCENKDRFQEENPNHAAKVVISLDEMGAYGALNRSTAGGGIGLYRSGSVGGAWLHYVVWGTGYTKVGVTPITTIWSPDWPGTTVSALTANSGYTLRYVWANSSTARNNWTYDIVHYPGYKLGASGAKEWLLVELPAMELSLKSDISSGFTGVTVLSKPGGDSNNGLPRSGSFTVQIGTEQMTASVSGATGLNITARAQNGTSPALHVAGDPVYFVDVGVATDGYLIRQLAWEHIGGTVHPKDFKLYTANLVSPRTPAEPNYTLDYSTPIQITNNTAASWASSTISRRSRHVLFECTLTTSSIGRVRLNSLKAIVDEATFNSATWLATGNAGDLIVGILTSVGVPSGAIADSTTVANMSDNSTAKGKAWTVISDVADFGGVFVDVDLMSHITIRDDSLWSASTITPTVHWDRSNCNNPQLSADIDAGISQASMKWRNADNSASGTVAYPTTADDIGEVKDLGEYVYPDAAAAGLAVQKKWAQLRFPYTVTLLASEDSHQVVVGAIHDLTWKIDPVVAATYRIFYVTEVNHVVQNRTVATSIVGNEVARYVGEQ